MAKRRRRVVATVRRGDAAEVIERDESTTREGQFLELREPQFLSIVKAPANRAPFKVVRGDEPTKRRRRKTADQSLLSVVLPDEITREEAEELFVRFGLNADDYDIIEQDGHVEYHRKKRTGDESSVAINLGEGITAYVEAEALRRGMPETNDHPGVTVLRFSFISKAIGEAWLQDHSIDIAMGKWLETDDIATFCRFDVDLPDDAKEIDVDDDVTAIVAQTREDDIPARIYRAVIEEAYGNYGYGIIDFNQAMADVTFTTDAKEANYKLWDILDNILFYSYLPLADRQALVMNALNQFAVWLTNLMSALPREMTEPNRRIDLNSQGEDDDNAARSENDPSSESKETADMLKSKEPKAQGEKDQDTVARQDASGETSETKTDVTATDESKVERTDAVAAEETETKVEDKVEDTEKVFTRSEARAIAERAVDSYIEEKQTKRSEDPNVTALAGALKEVMGPGVTRLDALQTELDKVKNTTVARADDHDGDDPAQAAKETEEEVKRKDPYRGAIFGGAADKLYQRG